MIDPLIGEYELQDRIGRSGRAAVYPLSLPALTAL